MGHYALAAQTPYLGLAADCHLQLISVIASNPVMPVVLMDTRLSVSMKPFLAMSLSRRPMRSVICEQRSTS